MAAGDLTLVLTCSILWFLEAGGENILGGLVSGAKRYLFLAAGGERMGRVISSMEPILRLLEFIFLERTLRPTESVSCLV